MKTSPAIPMGRTLTWLGDWPHTMKREREGALPSLFAFGPL